MVLLTYTGDYTLSRSVERIELILPEDIICVHDASGKKRVFRVGSLGEEREGDNYILQGTDLGAGIYCRFQANPIDVGSTEIKIMDLPSVIQWGMIHPSRIKRDPQDEFMSLGLLAAELFLEEAETNDRIYKRDLLNPGFRERLFKSMLPQAEERLRADYTPHETLRILRRKLPRDKLEKRFYLVDQENSAGGDPNKQKVWEADPANPEQSLQKWPYATFEHLEQMLAEIQV